MKYVRRAYLRRITSHDALQAGVLAWWGIALFDASPAQRAASPLFGRMTDIMPYAAWIVVPCVLAVLLIVAALAEWRRGLMVALITTAAWWGIWTWLIWTVSQTYLTPGLTAAFCLAAILRQAELHAKAVT